MATTMQIFKKAVFEGGEQINYYKLLEWDSMISPYRLHMFYGCAPIFFTTSCSEISSEFLPESPEVPDHRDSSFCHAIETERALRKVTASSS